MPTESHLKVVKSLKVNSLSVTRVRTKTIFDLFSMQSDENLFVLTSGD